MNAADPTNAVNPLNRVNPTNPNIPDPSMPSRLTTGVAAGVTYVIGPSGSVLVDGNAFQTSVPTTSTLADGRVVIVGPTGAVSVQERPSSPQPAFSLTPRDYILGAFVPTIIAVLFGIPWRILAAAIEEMEPFYQMQRPAGALAEKSLTLQYRASINIVAVLSAIRNGHFVVWWSGLIYVVILFLAPLASETVFIGFVDPSRCTTTSRTGCIPELAVFPVAARVVEGILAFVAILTFALAIAIARRRSRLHANPSSIAGLATLFQDHRVIEDFRRISSYCPNSKELQHALRGNRYRIGEHIGIDGNSEYGITSIHGNAQLVETSHQNSHLDGKKYASVAVNPVEESPNRSQQKKKTILDYGTHAAVVIFFALLLSGLLVLVVYYNRVGGDTPFERFMDSGSFGTTFLFTGVGVLVKMYWTFLDDGTLPFAVQA